MSHSKVCLMQNNSSLYGTVSDFARYVAFLPLLPHNVKIFSSTVGNQKFLKYPFVGGVLPLKNQYSILSRLWFKCHFPFGISDPSLSFGGLLFRFSYVLCGYSSRRNPWPSLSLCFVET